MVDWSKHTLRTLQDWVEQQPQGSCVGTACSERHCLLARYLDATTDMDSRVVPTLVGAEIEDLNSPYEYSITGPLARIPDAFDEVFGTDAVPHEAVLAWLKEGAWQQHLDDPTKGESYSVDPLDDCDEGDEEEEYSS
jgi:hypothetical protein